MNAEDTEREGRQLVQGFLARRSGIAMRIVSAILGAAFLPLVLTGVGSWLVFGEALDQRALELHRHVVKAHGAAIDFYLDERLRVLKVASLTHSFDELTEDSGLERLFRALNQGYDEAFVDLGVIDASGAHVAYVGPYDLSNRNYANADWFRYVMVHGTHVSDVFLGFRGVPHCVIAIRREERGQTWILRATINSAQFDELVRTNELGQTGDAFVVNTEGIYQTPPRSGKVLGQSSLESPQRHRDVKQLKLERDDGTVILRATTWINGDRWLLVAQQAESEIRSPVKRALLFVGLVVLMAVVLMVVTTLVATRHLTSKIAQANEQKEAMAKDLLRSSRLASLGELATGLAHEINNPLAIISAEQTNISDIVSTMEKESEADKEEVLQSAGRIRKQVERAGAITAKMLQFGRHGGTKAELSNVASLLRETVELLRRQAVLRNVELTLDAAPDLPPLFLDGTELQQVLVNLINNSFQAMANGGVVKIKAKKLGAMVELSVRDDGPGIPADDLDKVFQPFFTTKPVGKGTGLGLSVCYGLVHSWGGTIVAESDSGVGTTMRIRIPIPKTDRPIEAEDR